MLRCFRVHFFSVVLPAMIMFVAGNLVPVRAHSLAFGGYSSINEQDRVQLAGNTHPQATSANDGGLVSDSLPLNHLILQMKRPQDREQALETTIAGLTDPHSANFHQWLTPAQIGQQFGPSPSDLQTVVAWLKSYGFVVHDVLPSGMAIDFSGDAATIRAAFRTDIHKLTVAGRTHIGNMSDPSIPAALAPSVTGIVSLHDFRPAPKARPRYTFGTTGNKTQAVAPGDLATIYDLTRLYGAGISGQGQTIAVLEDTDLYSSADWAAFRQTFGLSSYTSGSLVTLHPASTSGSACQDPGVVTGNDQEAALDVEWASAAAPSAAIMLASCADSATTFGGFIALQNLINSAAPPQIVSISYGNCETENGAAGNAAIKSLYQQAAAQGISVFVSAGDEGAASCDAGATGATHGIGVSAFASTAYNVAVGGTDFADAVTGTTSNYWKTTNTANHASAVSYIPEIPWNDSCAGQLLSSYLGFATGYGPRGLCASNTATYYGLQSVVSGSGGPSGCATGYPYFYGVVSGSCAGTPKPSWQTGTGVPTDGVRDIPDLALFAADGLWGHYFIFCYSNTSNGGAACTGTPSNWSGGGGTSFSAPIMAGIQAMVNQKAGGKQGNPNPVYYKLAALSGRSCNASGTIGNGCIFHTVTSGDIDINCSGTRNCYGATSTATQRGFGFSSSLGQNGALSLSSQSFKSAYSTDSGWSFATGLGSVDGYNLVMNWSLGQ